jgi:hypothetical protein
MLTSVGRRSATQAIARLLVKMLSRGNDLGLVRGQSVPLPYLQQELADALGLSLVHTDKTLTRLCDRQLADWSDELLIVSDTEKLAREAGTENEPPPRRPLI